MLIRRQVLRDCIFGAKSVQLHKRKSGPRIQINKAEQSRESTFMLCLANMKYKGLVDPKDKPFGRVFPFESCFGWNVFYDGQAKEVAAGI